MSQYQSAPIFTATWDFSVWLLKKTRAAPQDPLARSLASSALRLRLRLAMETELLSAQQAHYALEQTDAIGRQLGGWRKAQNRAE